MGTLPKGETLQEVKNCAFPGLSWWVTQVQESWHSSWCSQHCLDFWFLWTPIFLWSQWLACNDSNFHSWSPLKIFSRLVTLFIAWLCTGQNSSCNILSHIWQWLSFSIFFGLRILPASIDDIILFVEIMAVSYGYGQIKNVSSSITFLHKILDLPFDRESLCSCSLLIKSLVFSNECSTWLPGFFTKEKWPPSLCQLKNIYIRT